MIFTGDPLWTDEDRAWALAWQAYLAELCSGCGHSLTETLEKKNQFAYDAEIIRCHACAATHRVMEKFTKDGGNSAGAMTRFKREPELT